jgi:hypothetical protein
MTEMKRVNTIDLNQINMQAKKFSLSNAQSPVAIWSMFLSEDDQYLFVGQSDGQLRAFEVADPSNSTIFNENIGHLSCKIGITHLIQIKKSSKTNTTTLKKSQKSLLLKDIDSLLPSSLVIPQIASTTTPRSSINNNINNQQLKLSENKFELLILAARLNGQIQLIKFSFKKMEKLVYSSSTESNNMLNQTKPQIVTTITDTSFALLSVLKINGDESPITSLYYPHFGDYMMITSQDCLLKVIKLSSSANGNNEEINLLFGNKNSNKIIAYD